MADVTTSAANLAALSELSDYRVASGNPDIRGWTVYSSDGNEIGRVRDLVVDVDALKVRYMVVGLKHGLFAQEHQVVVPIGRARLDDTSDRVYVENVSASNIGGLHQYDPSTFRTQERSVFSGDYTTADYDDSRFWGARRRVSDSRTSDNDVRVPAESARVVEPGDVQGDPALGPGGLRKKEPV